MYDHLFWGVSQCVTEDQMNILTVSLLVKLLEQKESMCNTSSSKNSLARSHFEFP